MMHERDIRDESRPPPGGLDSQCVVGIFEVGRVVAPVEAAERDVFGPPDEPAGGRRVVDIATEDVRLVARHHVGPAYRCRERVAEEELPGLLKRAVVVHEDGCSDPDDRIVERGNQWFEPSGSDDHIRIQEAEELATRVLDAEFVPAGEAEIVGRFDEADVGSIDEESGRSGRRDRSGRQSTTMAS